MTYQNFNDFKEKLLELDKEGIIDIYEINFPEDSPKYITIKNISETNPIHIVEVMLWAYDSGFHFGSFFSDRYGGCLTISE